MGKISRRTWSCSGVAAGFWPLGCADNSAMMDLSGSLRPDCRWQMLSNITKSHLAQ
jgi:hypothetical protein